MGSIGILADTDKIGGSDFAELLVDDKIPVFKKGKGDLIFFAEHLHLISAVSGADADEFDFVFEGRICGKHLKEAIDRGSLPLAKRSVHAENFDDHYLCVDIRN